MKAIKEIIGLLTDIRDELRKFNAPAQPKVEPKQEPKMAKSKELIPITIHGGRRRGYRSIISITTNNGIIGSGIGIPEVEKVLKEKKIKTYYFTGSGTKFFEDKYTKEVLEALGYTYNNNETIKLNEGGEEIVGYRKWTKDEEKQLSNLYRNGYTYEEMAEALTRTVAAIDTRLKLLRRLKQI